MGPSSKVKQSIDKICEVGLIGVFALSRIFASNRRASVRIFVSPVGSEGLFQVQGLGFASGILFSVSYTTNSPITMNLLRFITVENLCLAAEITAALLLIAFSIPDRKKPVAAPTTTDDSESQKRMEVARRAHCQATVFRGIAALANRCTDDPAAGHFELYTPLALLGWEDRLTKRGNRLFLDAFLEEWLSLPESVRKGSLLTMIVVDKYSDLLREQGAMGVEQSLRNLGERIANHYESTSIIGRYQPDRFLVVQFGRSLAEAHEVFDSLNNSASSGNEESPSASPPVPCVASIVELGDAAQSLSDYLDKLDEGVAQAMEAGSSCVSEFEGTWTNKRPITDQAHSVPRDSVPQGIHEEQDVQQERRRLAPESPSIGDSTHSENTSESPIAASADKASTSTEPKVAPEVTDPATTSASPTQEPTDVSAVASSEDIAALFEQINKKKKESPSSEPASTATPESPNPAETLADDALVGADDIAALFAANAPAKKPAPESKAQKITKPAAKPDSKLNELLSNLNNDVTNDDLNSLFANVQ